MIIPDELVENKAVDSLDYVTRMRLRERDRITGLFILLFGVATFFLGMIVGSALHDLMFHAVER